MTSQANEANDSPVDELVGGMTDQSGPTDRTGSGNVESGFDHDPEVAEAYADEVGVDPTPDQIEHYQDLSGAKAFEDRDSGEGLVTGEDPAGAINS